MGIQSSLYKILYPTEPMTTVMTGNVIQIALEIFGHGAIPVSSAVRKNKIRATLRLILGFSLGCFAGAWATNRLALGALIVPAFLLLALGMHRYAQLSSSLADAPAPPNGTF